MSSAKQLRSPTYPAPWPLLRISRMSAGEVTRRARDLARQLWWHRRRGVGIRAIGVSCGPPLPLRIPACARRCVSEAAALDAIAAADLLLRGKWRLFGEVVDGVGGEVDWFRDPSTGRSAHA